MKKYAVIDLGSLKVKLTIGSIQNSSFRKVFYDYRLTLLGKGINKKKHRILEESINDTIKAVGEFLFLCEQKDVEEIKIVATESLRKAKNQNEFYRKFKEKTKQEYEIIDQNKEADMFFKAVVSDIRPDGEIVLVDMGGGSVQLLFGSKNKLRSKYFLPIGVYLLQQRHISDRSDKGKATKDELRRLEDEIRSKIAKIEVKVAENTPIVYGSTNVLDLVRFLQLQTKTVGLSKRHRLAVSSDEFLKFLGKINNLTHAQREKKYPFQWGYMWGIQVAFLNIYHIAKKLGSQTIVPSNVNLAEGFVWEMSGNCTHKLFL